MEQFGKYQLVRRLGAGGMAEVFLARTAVAQGLNKELVIKKIHPAFARSRQFQAMFVDEAKIALSLNHPNIVQVFDFGSVGDTFFLAMEHVEGLDLLRLMQETGKKKTPLPLGLCAYIVQQMCKGLDYAHRKTDEYGEPLGIVHRDVSPQNVLISYDGAVQILDFGIARARGVQEEEGVVKGKFAYMAPEQARGEVVDRRADVFALGVILFELCCRRPLFAGKGKEVLEKVKTGAIPRPRDANKEMPDELEMAILKSLTFHRDDRFQTSRDLQTALGMFQAHEAQAGRGLVDSSTLAQFVSRTVPAEKRRAQRRPPTAPIVGGVEDVRDPDDEESAELSRGIKVPDHLLPPAPREIRERKYVFVIEGQVCGLPSLETRVGRKEALRIVQDFFKVAGDIAYKHEAVIHSTRETSFTFAIGLPVTAEDDASRSIRLALSLVEALDGIGHDVEPELRLAVGVQRGTAVVRSRKGVKFEYELGAATTQIARHLAAEAHGADILCGGTVYRVARGDWNFEELATIQIPADPDTNPDGTAQEDSSATQSARVYRLRGRKEREQRLRERADTNVELIGRDLELKALRDAYRDVLVNGKLRNVLVLGEAGLGKRALASALLDTIPKDEATILRAAARAATAYTPYGIIADLARDLFGLAETAPAREIQKRLEVAAKILYPGEDESREVRGLLQAVGMLLGTRVDDDVQIDVEERHQRILEAMIRVERRFASDKPMVVIVEDAHWADEQSMALFKQLIKLPTSRGILGVITARPEGGAMKVAEETGSDVILLEELTADQQMLLIARRFVPGEDVRELGRQLIARAGGNPFFLTEMLDALVDRGILVPEGDDSEHAGSLRWVKRDAPIQVPTSVESLLATRIDRLTADIKETLIHAAVLGRRFRATELESLLGRPVDKDLAELATRNLVREDSNAFSFRNEVTLTVAYQSLPDEERRALHRTVAAGMCKPSRYREGQDDAIIARHLELAGDNKAAAERYLNAANHAIDVGGNNDAFRQLTRALKLLPASAHDQRFAARKQREEILRRLARRGAQLREINSMRKEAEALGDDHKLALTHTRLAQFYIDVGKTPSASKAVAPALEYARKANNKLAEAEALHLLSAISRLTGESEKAIKLSDEALALCDDSRDGLLSRAKILNNRGTTLWNMSRLREAIDSYAEALVIYRMLKLPRQEARSLNNMGVVCSALGETEQALAHYKSSLKLDQRLGDRVSIALKLGNIGQTYADLGDLARGEKYLRKALALSESNEDRSSMTDVVISLGQVNASRGDHTGALELFERGLSLATEGRDRYQEIRALIYVSLSKIELGALQEALDQAASATGLAEKMPMPVGVVYGLAAQGLALAGLDRASEGAELTSRAVNTQAGIEQPEGYEQVLHIHSKVSEAAGDIAAAAKAIAQAAAEVQRKAANLTNLKLREIYLASKVPREIMADKKRLSNG